MRRWPGPASAVVLLFLASGVAAAAQRSVLNRVASAVDGAESSHGQDMAMWRPDPSAPQGPMQVSAAAATDVGSGDRFDAADNRAIGRAYLELLYRRYRNWPDAIAAYNWGIGKLNAWLAAGRPAAKLAKGVAAYTDRVLRDSGLCNLATGAGGHGGTGVVGTSSRRRRGSFRRATAARLPPAACAEFGGGPLNRVDRAARWRSENRLLVGLLPPGFDRQVETLMDRTELDLRAAARR